MTALLSPPRRSAIPPSGGPPKALGLEDESRFLTIHGHPILDSHQGTKKRVRSPDHATPNNPDGLVEQILECDEDDLKTAAANTNRAVAAGRPPQLKLGHEPLEKDKPESHWPKPIGMASNFQVRSIDGKPWLCCDLHYRREHVAEAMTYPNISVERTGWNDPAEHTIHAVSLLRRRGERPIPMVPYGANPMQLVCYGREVPAPSDSSEPLPGELLAYAMEHALFDPRLVRLRLLGRDPRALTFRANYAADQLRKVACSRPVASGQVGSTTTIPGRDPKPILYS